MRRFVGSGLHVWCSLDCPFGAVWIARLVQSELQVKRWIYRNLICPFRTNLFARLLQLQGFSGPP